MKTSGQRRTTFLRGLCFVIAAVIVLATLSLAADESHEFVTGTLLDITHQDSSRVVGNPGSMVSVVDREYLISVKLDRMTYVGSYWPRWKWSYEPTEFIVNSGIKVRIEKNEMFVLRAGGKELKTKIVKRIAEPVPEKP